MSKWTFWELVRDLASDEKYTQEFIEKTLRKNLEAIRCMPKSKAHKALVFQSARDGVDLTEQGDNLKSCAVKVRQHLRPGPISHLLWTWIVLGLPFYKDNEPYNDFHVLDLPNLTTTEGITFDEKELGFFLQSHQMPLPSSIFGDPPPDFLKAEGHEKPVVETPADRSSPAPDRPSLYFERKGNFWEIFCHGERVIVKDLVGIQYLSYLLEKPGKDISCVSLCAASNPHPNAISAERAAAEGLGKRSKRQVGYDKKMMSKIMGQIQLLENEMENENDPLIIRENENEIDGLKRELQKSLKIIDEEKKNAQSKVIKSLQRAYNRINNEKILKHISPNIYPNKSYDLIYQGPAWTIYR